MKIPNLPTDNLYKFASIFGLVLIVFSSYMFNRFVDEVYQFEDNLNAKNSLHKLDSLKISSLDSLDIKRSKIILEKDLKKYNRIVKKIPKLIYLYWFLFFLGFGLSIWGFYNWLYKTQKLNDRILSNEVKKIENEKVVLVHKIQFEKEFEVYKELWPELMRLKQATLELRPICEIIPKGLSDKEIEEEKSKNFNEPFNKCAKIFLENQPFYPKEIFEEIESILKTCRKEAYSWRDTLENRLSNYKNAEEHAEEITSKIDSVCLKIRDRIGLMKINN